MCLDFMNCTTYRYTAFLVCWICSFSPTIPKRITISSAITKHHTCNTARILIAFQLQSPQIRLFFSCTQCTYYIHTDVAISKVAILHIAVMDKNVYFWLFYIHWSMINGKWQKWCVNFYTNLNWIISDPVGSSLIRFGSSVIR